VIGEGQLRLSLLFFRCPMGLPLVDKYGLGEQFPKGKNFNKFAV